MTADPQGPCAGTSPPPSPPQLRPARFEDYPQIERLEAAHLPTTMQAEEWPRLWLDNPLWPRLSGAWPIGWVLEDGSGQVVGSMTNVPSLYRFRDRELVCANARAWVSHPDHRSYAPWLMEEFFTQPGVDLYISTTANANAEPICRTFATRVPAGDWQTSAYWITGYRGFAGLVLRQRGFALASALAIPAAAALWLKDTLFARALPASSSGADISASDGFDSRFDLFWEELVRQNPSKLLATRDSRTLSWHYAIPLRRKRLWIFTAQRNGLLRAYCVLNRQDFRQEGRRMRVIDYQTLEPDVDLLPELLKPALARCAAEDFYVLDHLGCGLPRMRGFDRLAPYRYTHSNWPFYYHTADPALAAELSRPEAWEPSTFDGDASID
jgi:hypothetical protein